MQYKKTVSLCCAVLLYLGCAESSRGGSESAEELFHRGEELLTKNCGECRGATREGLEAGIEEIRRALAAGYGDRIAALRLLEDAYGQLGHVFAEPRSAAKRQALAEQRRLLAELVELDDVDVDILFDYALAAPDPEDRRAALERILELEPEHLEALFALGQLEVALGAPDSGLDRMREAFETSAENRAGRDARYFGSRLVWALQRLGHDREAQEIIVRLKQMGVDK